MQHHIPLCLQEAGCTAELFHPLLAHDWGRASQALGFFLGTVSAHGNKHTIALPTCRRRNHCEPRSKAAQGQRQLGNFPALKSTVSGQKDFPHLPLASADSSLHPHAKSKMNSFALRNLFPHAESRHQLEAMWQKQSSQKGQLRKLLLPTTSSAALKPAAHTLLSALSFSALGTILSLPSPRVRIQRQRHQALLTHDRHQDKRLPSLAFAFPLTAQQL